MARAPKIPGLRPNPRSLTFDEVHPGDRVTILVPAGRGRQGVEYREATGRVVMRGPAGWVLNMGGAHGTPGVATPENFVRATKGKRHGGFGTMRGNPVVAAPRSVNPARRARKARTQEQWWAWHDASQVRHSPTMEEALARCAAWVRGESDDGPHLTVTMEPAEDEDECERLGLRRIYTVRSGSRVVWAGEADSEADALSHVR